MKASRLLSIMMLLQARGRMTAPVLQGAVSAAVPPGWKEFLMPIESIEHGARKLLGYGAQVKALYA
jgi:hypothetical protein